MVELGRLKRVNLGEAWESEAQDFTPWLAQDENISILSETLDMELEVEAQEKNVGPFRADILCRDANSTDRDSLVLIENQLERTDHTHLGQLMTYAAGLHTVSIIWIAERFTDQHRAALDWLNEITDERFRFFGLEVELWKIGDSLAAPKFNIVSKPNEWSRKASASPATESATGNLHIRYWTSFADYLKSQESSFTVKKPWEFSYLDFPIGKAHCLLRATLRKREQRVSLHLNLSGPNREAHLGLLKQEKDAIEEELRAQPEWKTFDKSEQILLINQKRADFSTEGGWGWQHQWFADTLLLFRQVFQHRVKGLDAANYVPDGPPVDDLADDE